MPRPYPTGASPRHIAAPCASVTHAKMYYSRLGLYSHSSHLESRTLRRSRRSGARARGGGDCVVQEALSYRTTPRSIIEVHVMCAHAPGAIHSTMQTAHMRMLATSYARRAFLAATVPSHMQVPLTHQPSS